MLSPAQGQEAQVASASSSQVALAADLTGIPATARADDLMMDASLTAAMQARGV